MRIAINALAAQAGGGLTYLQGVLRHLPAISPEDTYLILTSRKDGLPPEGGNVLVRTYPARSVATRTVWEQLVLPAVLRRERVDLLYAIGNQGPVLRSMPFVLLVQNVGPLVRSHSRLPLPFRVKMAALRMVMQQSVHGARRVIAVSDYTRSLLSQEFGVSPQLIDVIPHGAPDDADLAPAPAAVEQVARYGLVKPFFLTVSNLTYNKNLETLLVAFAMVSRTLDYPVHLAVAGEVVHGWYLSVLRQAIGRMAVVERVRWLGWVPPEVLRVLYAEAVALVFPSRVESFGLPALEAMAYGLPVVASRIPALEEVCGDAAVYFDPDDAPEAAEAMVRLAVDPDWRRAMVALGRVRAQRFTWVESAQRTAAVLHVCAEAADPRWA